VSARKPEVQSLSTVEVYLNYYKRQTRRIVWSSTIDIQSAKGATFDSKYMVSKEREKLP